MYSIISLDIMEINTLGEADSMFPAQKYTESWNASDYRHKDHSVPVTNKILQVGSGLDTSISVLIEIPDNKYKDYRARKIEAFKQGKELMLQYLDEKPSTHFKSDL